MARGPGNRAAAARQASDSDMIARCTTLNIHPRKRDKSFGC
jgi:hypothetical protein